MMFGWMATGKICIASSLPPTTTQPSSQHAKRDWGLWRPAHESKVWLQPSFGARVCESFAMMNACEHQPKLKVASQSKFWGKESRYGGVLRVWRDVWRCLRFMLHSFCPSTQTNQVSIGLCSVHSATPSQRFRTISIRKWVRRCYWLTITPANVSTLEPTRPDHLVWLVNNERERTTRTPSAQQNRKIVGRLDPSTRNSCDAMFTTNQLTPSIRFPIFLIKRCWTFAQPPSIMVVQLAASICQIQSSHNKICSVCGTSEELLESLIIAVSDSPSC